MTNKQKAKELNDKGYSLDDIGEYEEALECFNEAIRLYLEYEDAWHNKGVALAKLDMIIEADECFDRAVMIKKKRLKEQGLN